MASITSDALITAVTLLPAAAVLLDDELQAAACIPIACPYLGSHNVPTHDPSRRRYPYHPVRVTCPQAFTSHDLVRTVLE